MPLCEKIHFPANAAFVNEKISEFAFFDLIPTDKVDERIYDLPVEKPFNLNFQMFGYESRLYIGNVGFALWLVWAHAFIFVIYVLTIKVNFLRRRIGRYLFWNSLVRLFTEVFFEMSMFAVLNLIFYEKGS